jgi:hypothetical protein
MVSYGERRTKMVRAWRILVFSMILAITPGCGWFGDSDVERVHRARAQLEEAYDHEYVYIWARQSDGSYKLSRAIANPTPS